MLHGVDPRRVAATTATDAAKFLLRFCAEHGDPLTNLKLQKYLYYAQGWYLAFYNEPLFDDRLEAWVHGPVQPYVYGQLKRFGWDPIAVSEALPPLAEEVELHLIEVHSAYGQFSAWDLERMTHAEAPWREARGGIPDDEPSKAILSHESMRRYFHGRLQEQGSNEGGQGTAEQD